MREELVHRHARRAGPVELGYVGRDRGVELHRAALDQDHECRRRCDHLRERSEVVQSALGSDRRARRRPGEVAVALGEQDGVAPADHQRRARIRTLPDAVQDEGIERCGVKRRRPGYADPGAVPRRCGRPGL